MIASAPDLAPTGAVLVPNGVNPALFSTAGGAPPADLPAGRVLGYHGSLYGDWFDWDAVARLAAAEPDSAVVLIGDTPAKVPPLPGNVHLLGLKPQHELARYVERFDVGLLPFVVSPTTHAVSPLKVFEYLACGVPVAAPPLRSLAGLAGVATASDLVAAVAAARRLPRPDPALARRDHSWEERVGRITAALGVADPGGGRLPALVLRPAVHYRSEDRAL